MNRGNAGFLRLFAGIYFSFLIAVAVICGLYFFVATGAENHAVAVSVAVISAFAGFGGILLLVLKNKVLIQLNCLTDYSNCILQGDYSGAAKCQPKDLGELGAVFPKLVEAYKERLGFSQSILEGLPLGCCIVDLEEKITFLNQECLDLLGSQEIPQSFYGRMISQIFYKDDRKSLIGHCMDDDTRAMNRDLVFKHINGSDINALANLFPLHDVAGTVIGGCCLYINTTELKQREAHILEQNERIAHAAEQADGVVDDLSNSASILKQMVTDARNGAVMQSEQSGQAATAMEEMNATVLEVAGHAQQAAGDAESAKEQAEEGARAVAGVVAAIDKVAGQAAGLKVSMEELDGKAAAIGNVLGVIEDIADQTNLLALNAAIEAARAGEAGRGFAVVADEVRKLAEKTVQATSEVHQAVSGIQQGAKNNVKATEAAVEAVLRSTELSGSARQVLEQIVAVSEGSSDRIRAIATASEQQAAASEQISRNATEVNRISIETERTMIESADAISKLTDLSENLAKIIHEMQ